MNSRTGFSPTAMNQLEEAGQWLKVNGEAIFETQPRPGDLWKEGADASFTEPQPENGGQPAATGDNVPIRFTRSKDGRAVFAICMQWPGPKLRLRTVRPKQDAKITLLGVNKSLTWHNDPAEGLVVDIPSAIQDEAKRPGKGAWAFRIEGEQA